MAGLVCMYVCMYACPTKEFRLYLEGNEKPLN